MAKTNPDDYSETIELDCAVLGGGFAGVYCAKALAKQTTGKRIGVIADENHMTFQPMLPEVAGGSLAPRHVVNPIRRLAKGSLVYKAAISEIDLESRTIRASAGSFTPDIIFKYEHLVLTVGAVVDLSRIPGMGEHAYLIQNVGDAMKLRAAIIGRVEEANLVTNKARRSLLLNFVIVGGGYSGVETAGQIVDLLNGIHQYYGNVDLDDFTVTLIHSRDVLLPTLSPTLGKYTEKCLIDQGVNVVLNRRVKSVTARQVVLDDGSVLPATTVVSTVGNAPNPLITDMIKNHGIEGARGKVITDRFLRVCSEAHENIWAAGDCAAVPFAGKDSEYCPPTAQFAQRQGTTAGRNIASVLEHPERGMKAFDFTGLGEMAAIGHRRAVASAFGINISGFLAWWMWRTVYLSKLPGLDRKIRVIADWTLDIFFSKDISLLTPKYTSALKEAHLDPGDVLFQSGEPAFSFYFVKVGAIDIVDDEGGIVRTITEGDHFGERALLEDRLWRYNAVARESSTLVALGDSVFRQLVAGSTDISRLFTDTAAAYATSEEINTVAARIPAELRGKTALDLMATEISVLTEGQNLGEAMELFREEPHSTYPVVDASGGKLVGVLRRSTVYDLLKRDTYSAATNLGDIRLTSLPTALPESLAGELLEKMIRSGTSKTLIIDSEDKLLGIIALVDLLGQAR